MASLKDAGKYLSLADAIQTLKSELLKAETAATRDDTALFELEDCEIELAVEFTPKAGVGFDIYVFKAEVGAEATGTHRLTVRYKPIRPIVAAALDDADAPAAIAPRVPARKASQAKR